VKGLVKRIGTQDILREVDLEVDKGEAVVVIGPSGSGKTTLLRCINFLEEYQEGRIYVAGRLVGYRETANGLVRLGDAAIAAMRAEVGMVFQSFNLFPHMTALANVALGLRKVRKLDDEQAHDKAAAWLKRVGLGQKLDSYPSQLSGGQQQRVGIARAVAMDPKVVLFDEVTSALDPELVNEVLAVMEDLARGGMTMLVVTHEMRFAAGIADRVVFMDGGTVVEQGSAAQLFQQPRSERLRAFLGHLEKASGRST
jgi:polar amino acid transport system ATP-binding protein